MTTTTITPDTTTKKLSSMVKDSAGSKALQMDVATHPNTNPSSLNRLSKIAVDDDVLLAIVKNMNTKRTTLDALKKHPSPAVRGEAMYEPAMRMRMEVEFGTGIVRVPRDGVMVEAVQNEAGWWVPRKEGEQAVRAGTFV